MFTLNWFSVQVYSNLVFWHKLQICGVMYVCMYVCVINQVRFYLEWLETVIVFLLIFLPNNRENSNLKKANASDLSCKTGRSIWPYKCLILSSFWELLRSACSWVHCDLWAANGEMCEPWGVWEKLAANYTSPRLLLQFFIFSEIRSHKTNINSYCECRISRKPVISSLTRQRPATLASRNTRIQSDLAMIFQKINWGQR